MAESERNEPKSLSTISNRTSARPASGRQRAVGEDNDWHAGHARALGEVDREWRIGREADRDQRVVRAGARRLLRPQAADIVDETAGRPSCPSA